MGSRVQSSSETKKLLLEILGSAVDDPEQLWAFHQRFESFRYPLHGFVLGDSVLVTDIRYQGNARRGLIAHCCKLNDENYVFGLADIELIEESDPARCLAAYREWLGVDSVGDTRAIRRALRQGTIVEASGLETFIVMAVNDRLVHCCRIEDKARDVIVHTQKSWSLVPGEILKVQTRKMWQNEGHLHLKGDMVQCRIDAAALALAPLTLRERGKWDPARENWVKEWESLPDMAEVIQLAGPRLLYEFETIDSARSVADANAIARSSDLMDFAIAEDVDPRPGYLVTRLLDLRCSGIKGFWSVVDCLTELDLGPKCTAEWHRRLVKLKGSWRMRGVSQTWSKPCVRPAGA